MGVRVGVGVGVGLVGNMLKKLSGVEWKIYIIYRGVGGKVK